jgi:hypothetical protein
MKFSTLIPLALLALAAIFSGCTPCDDPTDPECPNYDPCHGEVWVEPEIVIKLDLAETSSDTFFHVETDTIPFGRMLFSINTQYDSYLWTVGLDPRTFETPTFSLNFKQNLSSQDILITCIATRNSLDPCFPDMKLRDTLTKSFHIKAENEVLNGPIVGEWFGQIDGLEEDTSTIRIFAYIDQFGDTNYDVQMPGLCLQSLSITNMYKRFFHNTAAFHCNYRGGGLCCDDMEAKMILDPNDRDKMTMYFRSNPLTPDPNPGPIKRFIATRVK